MKKKFSWIIGSVAGVVLALVLLLYLVGPFMVERRPGNLLYEKSEMPIPGVSVRLRTHAVRHYGKEQELQIWCKSELTTAIDHSDWLNYMSIDFSEPKGWKLVNRESSVSPNGFGPTPSDRVYGVAPSTIIFDTKHLAVSFNRCQTVSFLSPETMAALIPDFLYFQPWHKSGFPERAFDSVEHKPSENAICLTINPARVAGVKKAIPKICTSNEGKSWVATSETP